MGHEVRDYYLVVKKERYDTLGLISIKYRVCRNSAEKGGYNTVYFVREYRFSVLTLDWTFLRKGSHLRSLVLAR